MRTNVSAQLVGCRELLAAVEACGLGWAFQQAAAFFERAVEVPGKRHFGLPYLRCQQ